MLDSNPSPVLKIPAIFIRLSEILPPLKKSSKKPWAKDIIKLTFQGFEVGQQKQVTGGQSPALNIQSQASNTLASASQGSNVAQESTAPRQYGPPGVALLVTEARMVVPVPAVLSILKERVDKDIAFHARTGAFAFRLLTVVGESVIPSLIERVMRVERLVDFVEVLHKHEKTLQCETVSLRTIIFRYGTATHFDDAMDIDAGASSNSSSYKATVDFSSERNIMSLILERGNPHIRVLDHLTKILNQKNEHGLDGIATILPLSLPALRALDSIETAWTNLPARGEVFLFTRAVEWYIIRYNIYLPSAPSSNPTAPEAPKTRRIIFHVKLLQHRSEPWWGIRRTDPRDLQGDEVDRALKAVWTGSGSGWQGMRVSGVAKPSGVEELVAMVDEVIRTMDVAKMQIVGMALPAPAIPGPGRNVQNLNLPQGLAQRNPGAVAAAMQRQFSQQRGQGQNQNQIQGQQGHSQNQARASQQARREVVELD